jgi:hypothetical protein
MKPTAGSGLVLLVASASSALAWSAELPRAVVRPAPPMNMPGVMPERANDKSGNGEIDCNSPLHWDGNRVFMFFSTGHPYRSEGPDFARLSRPSKRVSFDNEAEWKGGPRWIEATHKAANGKLYMWYHNEPHPMCGVEGWTAPRIGQMVSMDNGLHWKDQGLVLEAPPDSIECKSKNKYFTGGHGDFSVIADLDQRYLYFFISTYNRDVAEQGVAVARLQYTDLDEAKGKVHKWYKGAWTEPGIGGHVTPVFPVGKDWHTPDCDAFWGPSIHWNTYLKSWVILLNRAKDKDWTQEGIYVSFSRDIARPTDWNKPVKILDARELLRSKWYPQVVGTAAAKETDKLAGKKARLFVAGQGRWEIEFYRAGEATQPVP